MPQTIEAIYEDGVFKPIIGINLPEHYKFKIIIEETEYPDQQLKKSLQKGYHMGKINDINRENIYGEID